MSVDSLRALWWSGRKGQPSVCQAALPPRQTGAADPSALLQGGGVQVVKYLVEMGAVGAVTPTLPSPGLVRAHGSPGSVQHPSAPCSIRARCCSLPNI